MASDCHLAVSIALSVCALLLAFYTDFGACQTTEKNDATEGAELVTMPTTRIATTITTTTMTTTIPPPITTTHRFKSSGFKVTKQMAIGLTMGFCGFAVFLTISCCSWYWCCKVFKERQERNSPGDFRSGNAEPPAAEA